MKVKNPNIGFKTFQETVLPVNRHNQLLQLLQFLYSQEVVQVLLAHLYVKQL